MLQFFKYVFATIVGLFAFTFLLFFGLALLIGSIIAVSSANDGKATIESNAVIKLDLNYPIPQLTVSNPFSSFDFSTMKSRKALGLYDLCEAIKGAAKDPKVKGIYLPMGINPNGLATLEVLRRQLKEFKKSGKFIYAYGEMANQKCYYLAAVSDKIYLNPSGGMEITGFGREIMYYKNAFEKLGIEVQDFHCGAFKSAIEPFLRDKMSDPNREQLMSIYGDVYNHLLVNIAEDRKIDTAQLNDIINNLKATLPSDAKALKLVDATAYYDQVEAAIKEKIGTAKKEEFKFTEIGKYHASLDKNNESSNKVAVLCADGEIADGSSDDGKVGGEDFSSEVRKLRLDEKVKAIVLRINSPGGSALASDVMWRELCLAKQEKPLIISMGNLAASGGYFIACMGDRIFAEPNTITGSIGVFGLIPNGKKLLNEKLGITTDRVAVTKHGAFTLGTNPLDEEEKAMVQRGVEKTYQEFKERVAEGRKKDTAYIETIAQGHVYTGTQGLKIGLVDEIGGLDEAIAYAVKQANLKDYKIKLYPSEKSLQDQIKESLGEAKQNLIKSEMGEQQYRIFTTLRDISSSYGIQMRMPIEIAY